LLKLFSEVGRYTLSYGLTSSLYHGLIVGPLFPVYTLCVFVFEDKYCN